MKIHEMIEHLTAIQNKHGNLDVILQDSERPDFEDHIYEVESCDLKVVEEDEYPEYFNMPEGYECVLITN